MSTALHANAPALALSRVSVSPFSEPPVLLHRARTSVSQASFQGLHLCCTPGPALLSEWRPLTGVEPRQPPATSACLGVLIHTACECRAERPQQNLSLACPSTTSPSLQPHRIAATLPATPTRPDKSAALTSPSRHQCPTPGSRRWPRLRPGTASRRFCRCAARRAPCAGRAEWSTRAQ